MLPVAVHSKKEMFNLNKCRDLHLQRVMNTFLGFCAELSGLALYYYSLSIIRKTEMPETNLIGLLRDSNASPAVPRYASIVSR